VRLLILTTQLAPDNMQQQQQQKWQQPDVAQGVRWSRRPWPDADSTGPCGPLAVARAPQAGKGVGTVKLRTVLRAQCRVCTSSSYPYETAQ
jgi:hypothetical protein